MWRDANEDGLVSSARFRSIPGAPRRPPPQSFTAFALGRRSRGHRAPARRRASSPSLGEIVRAANLDRGVEPADPVAAGRDLRELGSHVGRHPGDHPLRDDRRPLRLLRPRRRRERAARRLPRPRKPRLHHHGLHRSGRYPPGRLIFEYDPNTNALGRTTGGLPTTLADDQWTLRAEVVF